MNAVRGESTEVMNPDAFSWQPLRILAGYRLLIVSLLTVLSLAARSVSFMRTAEPLLFQSILFVYLGLSVAAYLLVRARRPGFTLQVYFQLGLDIIAITNLILASGTLGNGLGALMVVAVAGLAMLVTRRTALLFAALASMVLLATQVLSHLQSGSPGVGYSQAGFLGVTIFVTALLSCLLSERARRNQELAESRGADLESMEALNAHIVQAMGAGVLALRPDGRVRLVNTAAARALGQAAPTHDADIATLCPPLAAAWNAWQAGELVELAPLSVDGRELVARFRPLGATGDRGTLIFVDDTAELRAQVQQSKLAALGTLTANIAHEIRNPLSAISHATQLLEESPDITDPDRRLLNIIRKQGGRLNRVVENVLQLSRRQAPNRSEIRMLPWLDDFVRDFREQYPQQSYRIETSVQPDGLTLHFDPDHLHQVLTNLCRNALQHGSSAGAHILITAVRLSGDRVLLEVSDNGKGIDAETAASLFQPFFTTSSTGTGLGLYLCRELCDANHARLSLAAGTTPAAAGGLGGARFQISLSEL